MPVINGVYLKDFTALPGAVADANIIPIAISGDNVAYRTTVSGIVTDARITAKLLTGLSVTGGAVVAADTILEAFGKVQNQINGKQGTITLTTTGTSGAATLISNTLNIPDYGSALSGYLPLTGGTLSTTNNSETLRISNAGTGYGLYVQSDSYFQGDVTFQSASNSLLKTVSGLLTAAVAGTDYQEPITLTTTGTSGAATFSANTLNIPNYADSFVGTVTSVAALTLGTTGSDLSSTVANGTTTPVITLQVPTASASNRGALSSADWTTFNGKQATITLTTTGTSGAATFSSNTLNIPNYADGGVLSLSAIGGTANANAATITGTVLNLQPASDSFGGVVTTGTQTFAGTKTLTGDLFISKSAPSIQLKAANSSVAGFILANASGTHHWSLNTDAGGAGEQGEFRIANSILGNNAIKIETNNAVTLLGGLAGTSASFSSTATATAFIPSGATVPTNGMYLSAANTLNFATNTTSRLSIASTGAATFINGAAKLLEIASNTATGGYTRFTYNTSTSIGYIGSSSQLSGSGIVSDLELRADNNLFLTTVGGSMKLASTGAATFSSSVTAATSSTFGTAVAAQNVQLNLNGVSGKAQRIEFQNSGVGQWLMGAGAATETSAFELYNHNGQMALSFAKATSAATFVGSVTATSGTFSSDVTAVGNLRLGTNNTVYIQIKNSTGTYSNLVHMNASDRFVFDGSSFGVTFQGGVTFASAITGTSATFSGAVSKGSGSFRIKHPLPSLSETHQLVHSFIEGPQADLIYRGKLTLLNGKAEANIDEVSTMTEGTFEVLCRDIQCFTTNESGWDLIKGKVIGNIIYIESQNETSTDEISWMIIGERKDKHMMDTEWTDENGKVIVEPLKPIEPENLTDTQ